jgi:enoyl-CoA hydratase/carnithine racemase
LARGLLSLDEIGAREAVDVGLAHSVVGNGALPPLPTGASVTAATTARDLMRASAPGAAGLALELAAFRLLFASGDPEEGASAFMEKRPPSF